MISMWCRYNEARICEGCMWCYDTEDEAYDDLKDEDTEEFYTDEDIKKVR